MTYDWKDRANCRDEDPFEFWAGKNEYRAAAKCAECDVPNTCLRYALDNKAPYGVWGGHRFYKGRRRPLKMRGRTPDGRIRIEVS